MEVSVEIIGIPEVAERLSSIPGGIRTALQLSILHALRRARTEAARVARERYNIPYGWLLKAIGTPRLAGLTGFLHVSGSRAPLGMFPLREIYPFGTAIQELKDALPINLLHTFVRGGRVMERVTPDTKRYPIMPMVGLSAPQMIGEKTEVYPKIEFIMEFDLYTEMERLINVILSGGIVPR